MAEIEIGLGKSGRRSYGFDELAIVPSRRTRDVADVDIGWQIDAYRFETPVIGAAMDGVTSPATAVEMGRLGAVGVLEVTRVASGARDDTEFSIFGSKGSLHFHISDPLFARWHDFRRGEWTHGAIDVKPVPGERPSAQVWPGGKYSQGPFTDAHLAAAYSFLLDVAEGKPSMVDFNAGLAAQEVVEAAFRSAERGGEAIHLPL